MKLTKSELKGMILEVLREELNEDTFGAARGGWAQGGARDVYKRAGGSIGGLHRNDFLAGKKTKQVLAKDLKPGMITNTGKIVRVTDIGWRWGEPCMEISYGGIGAQGSHYADTPNKNKVYDVLDDEAETEDVFEGLY